MGRERREVFEIELPCSTRWNEKKKGRGDEN